MNRRGPRFSAPPLRRARRDPSCDGPSCLVSCVPQASARLPPQVSGADRWNERIAPPCNARDSRVSRVVPPQGAGASLVWRADHPYDGSAPPVSLADRPCGALVSLFSFADRLCGARISPRSLAASPCGVRGSPSSPTACIRNARVVAGSRSARSGTRRASSIDAVDPAVGYACRPREGSASDGTLEPFARRR